MILLDAAPAPFYEPEATGSFDFVLLGSPLGAIALASAVAAVVAVAAVLIARAIRKKK